MNFDNVNWSDMLIKIVSAIIILILTALIARLVKGLLSKLLGKVSVLKRQAGSGETLADSLGTIASLVIWLFGLMAILNLFALTQVLAPIQRLLSDILAALPRIIGAALILFVGVVLAKIVRELAVTALQAANVDRYAERLSSRASAELDSGVGTAPTTQPVAKTGATSVDGPEEAAAVRNRANAQGGFRISTMVGQLLFGVIVLVVGIAALQTLGIRAISEPATQMLSMILNAIPLILGAGILLAIGVVVARFAGTLLESLLRSLNVNKALGELGVDPSKVDVAKIVARVVQIAIVLFFAVAATKMLGFPQITAMLNTILALAGKVLFGAVVIAAGVFIAGLLASIVGGQAGTIIRYATIVLFVAMGLKYMGLADSIVNLAFGALVVGGAAAAAIAFGLGGRDAAARQLEKVENLPGSQGGRGQGG